MSPRRNHLTLHQKAEALEAVQKGTAINRVAFKYGVHRTIILRLKKRKEVILSNVATTLSQNVRKTFM